MDVILVNELDEPIGFMEKMEAHRSARLHRAFSVFIFNKKGEMLLQQRALSKYHSGGLWTNACCSHPMPGESVVEAAERRLQEELGFYTSIKKVFDFTYQAQFDNGLTEHEFDHVLVGVYEDEMQLNPEEVAQVAYYPMDYIAQQLNDNQDQYTVWFQIAFPLVAQWIQASDYFNKPVHPSHRNL
jgi:isopentenyl-diphosphate Delta-isomerase